jgi:hypothetical protein
MNKETHAHIREIKAEDLEAIVTLFKETVYHVNAKDYTSEQLLVWVRIPRDRERRFHGNVNVDSK